MPTQRIIPWLQLKVFIGLAGLCLSALAIIFYVDKVANENYADLELLSTVKQLNVQAENIKRRANTYAQNAPRDYAPYFRDIVIFYPDFTKDLDAFEQRINDITLATNTLSKNIDSIIYQQIASSIDNLNNNWNTFRKGLAEKLGPDLKEPRLEWGAEYVQQNQSLVNNITGELITSIETAINNKLNHNSQLTSNAYIGAAIISLLGIAWFYFSIVRRINITVKGCQRVAGGDFGYQLPVKSKDELGSLAIAFNHLSARTRFVITALSKLNAHNTTNDKIAALVNESKGYLNIELFTFLSFSNETHQFKLKGIYSERKISDRINTILAKAAKFDQLLQKASEAGTTLKYDHLNESATQLRHSPLLQEIIKMGLLDSALIVPLQADNGQKGMIILVASDRNAFNDEQRSLMDNLSPYIANGFFAEEATEQVQKQRLAGSLA